MAVKKTGKKEAKLVKKSKKVEVNDEEEDAGGTSLDDAFGDEEGVEYAESKPRKEKKPKKGEDKERIDEDELEAEIEGIEKANGADDGEIQVKASKDISKVKKGDKVRVDGHEYEVDSHYVLIDHKSTKEMAIELFDPKTDKDYQLRYFDDQAKSTLEFYELQEIMFIKKHVRKVEW